MAPLTTNQGLPINLAEGFARGGEGVLHNVEGRPYKDVVAKIFHPDKRTPDRAAKLSLMVANQPTDPTGSSHVSLAWPKATLYENGAFVGFLMPRIAASKDILLAYTPSRRVENFRNFHWGYLHRAALNLCLTLTALHQAGYVIGDINEKNVLVDDRAMITLVDTDSFQVTDPATRKVYRSTVAMSGYVPPELQGVSLATIDRTQLHDRFALAVLLFKLLMEGNHPFTSVLAQHESLEGRMVFDDNIAHGTFPYAQKSGRTPPPDAPDFTTLYPDVQRLFHRCFVEGHRQPERRPTTLEWTQALTAGEKALVQCKNNAEHYYAGHMSSCPWCARAARGIVSQPLIIPRQQPLPSAGRIQAVAGPPARQTIPPSNTSGQGRGAAVPDPVRGLCWGGFLIPWLWCFPNRLWLPGVVALSGQAFGYYFVANLLQYGSAAVPTNGRDAAIVLALPFLYSLMILYLLFRGRDMAWRARSWRDVPNFRAAQRRWSWAALLVTIGFVAVRFQYGFAPETYFAPIAEALPITQFMSGDASDGVGDPSTDETGAGNGELTEALGEGVAVEAANTSDSQDSPSNGDLPKVRVQTNSANIRSGPSLDYGSIGVVSRDTLLPVLMINAERSWYYVELENGERGWIGSLVVEEIESLDDVPVAD